MAGIQQFAQKASQMARRVPLAAQPTWLLQGLYNALGGVSGDPGAYSGSQKTKKANVGGLPPTSGVTSVAPPAPGMGPGVFPTQPQPGTMAAAPPPMPVSSPDPMMNGPNPGQPPAGVDPAAMGMPPAPAPGLTAPMSDAPPAPLPANPPINPPRPRTATDAMNDAVFLQGMEAQRAGPITGAEAQDEKCASGEVRR